MSRRECRSRSVWPLGEDTYGDGKRWRIEGKGKERARLAVAVLDGHGFAYIIQEQN